MSTYSTLDDGPISEMSVQRVYVNRKRADARPAADPRAPADYQAMRKANPAKEPLPVTFKWVASLPPAARPVALLRHYPRIANSLALCWRNPAAFRECLYGLLVDKRGNRRGFPQDVLRDLLALRDYFERSCL